MPPANHQQQDRKGESDHAQANAKMEVGTVDVIAKLGWGQWLRVVKALQAFKHVRPPFIMMTDEPYVRISLQDVSQGDLVHTRRMSPSDR